MVCPIRCDEKVSIDFLLFVMCALARLCYLQIKALLLGQEKASFCSWYDNCILIDRASIEPNNHDTYIKFLDKMDSKELHKEVLRTTYENCKVKA